VAANTIFPLIAFSWVRIFIRLLNASTKKSLDSAMPLRERE
jgi:hypothetical protein